MSDKKIIEYIKIGKKKGASDELLKQKLIDRGHSPSVVEDAFKEYKKRILAKAYFLAIAVAVAVLIFAFAFMKDEKKTTQPEPKTEIKQQEPIKTIYTQEAQLSILNKTLNQKYQNFRIKNYGDVLYTQEMGTVLRAEVDLGYIDVCGQKIKADSAVFVVKDGKLIQLPESEIKARVEQFGEVMTQINYDGSTNLRRIDKSIPYNCSNNKCSLCSLKEVYELSVKLKQPYTKTVQSIDDTERVKSAIIEAMRSGMPSSEVTPEMKNAKLNKPSNLSTEQSSSPSTTGNLNIAYKRYVVDETGIIIYFAEGVQQNENIRYLQGYFVT